MPSSARSSAWINGNPLLGAKQDVPFLLPLIPLLKNLRDGNFVSNALEQASCSSLA